MLELLLVCTGNICRSPFAALVLASRLEGHAASVVSAGTHALAGDPATAESARLALLHGAEPTAVKHHRARMLTAGGLESPAIILALARDHRQRIAEIAPHRLRDTFTLREFARLAECTTDEGIRDAAAVGADPAERLRLAAAHVGSMRGRRDPLGDPTDDDVIDPYRRSERTYQLAAAQMVPAIDVVARVILAARG